MNRKPGRTRPNVEPADLKRVKPTLFIRIKFGDQAFIGPGKTELLELIDRHGSISAAGRAMGMSYRRAWMIIDGLNSAFQSPLVTKQTGGSGGGGAILTELGREVVARYRQIERQATENSAADLKALSRYTAGS